MISQVAFLVRKNTIRATRRQGNPSCDFHGTTYIEQKGVDRALGCGRQQEEPEEEQCGCSQAEAGNAEHVIDTHLTTNSCTL